MDRELHCDFYFGDNVNEELQKLDYSILKGFKHELKTLRFRSLKWHLGISRVFFNHYDYYIITGDTSYLSNWFLLLYCTINQKKLFLWCHGIKTYVKRRHKFINKLFFGNKIVELLLYGNQARNLMIDEGYSEKKLHVIYNSLDYEAQCKIRNTIEVNDIYLKHFKNSYPVIIFIGRLQNEKKLELIIESQKKSESKGTIFNAVFIGEGEMKETLIDLSEKLGIADKVWFYGPIYDELQIAPLIYNAALSVSPGGVGLTALHCLTYGTPVITHSNFSNQGPEFEAITKGITGDFFEEDNLDDLINKISIWLNRSEKNRAAIRLNCYKTIDAYFNPEYQINILKQILG